MGPNDIEEIFKGTRTVEKKGKNIIVYLSERGLVKVFVTVVVVVVVPLGNCTLSSLEIAQHGWGIVFSIIRTL